MSFKEKNRLLTDNELDKTAGGMTNYDSMSFYGTPRCHGPENCSILKCGDCPDIGYGSMHKTSFGETTAICRHK